MLNDSIKDSLYKAVVKYHDEIIPVSEESMKDVARIISIAKSLGFEVDKREKFGFKETVLLFDGKWYVSFCTTEHFDKKVVHVSIDEYSLLTGQALKDFMEHSEAEAHDEIEAERKMSAYNSGYRDF